MGQTSLPSGSRRGSNASTLTKSPFPFAELPIEIVLQIVSICASSSQSSYRALVLTSRTLRDVVRLECIPLVPVTLTTVHQIHAFLDFIAASPELASCIRYLWIIPSDGTSYEGCRYIVNFCTNVESLACTSTTLFTTICGSYRHTKCIHLTVKDWCIPWKYLQWIMEPNPVFEQLHTLHLIGPFANSQKSHHMPPAFTNLTSASFSYGHDDTVEPELYAEILRSPRLQRIAIITTTHGSRRTRLAAKLQEMGPRFTLVARPRRWTEAKIWMYGFHDQDCIRKLKPVGAVP